MAPERIRVLIADDAAAWREALKAMLAGSPEVEVVGEAEDGPQAVAATLSLRPDVVVMDYRLPRLDGAAATEAIRAEAEVAVVMVSVESHPEDFRRAMRAGARDYLVKPFGKEELLAAIRQAASWSSPASSPGGDARPASCRSPAQARTVTFFSGKGGVGKTTLAVNLATWLSFRGLRTVLADLDLEWGGAALLLGAQPRSTLWDLCRREGPLTEELVSKVLVGDGRGSLQLLAPPPEPHLAAEVDGDARREPGRQYVAEVLSLLRGMCDYLIVDTPTTFREATLAALDVADVVMLVSTPEIPGLHQTGRVLDVLLGSLGYPAEKIKVVVNRYQARVHLKPEQISRGLDHPVSYLIPADWATVTAAGDVGQPFVLKRGRSEIAQALVAMGEDLLGSAGPAGPVSLPSAPARGPVRSVAEGTLPLRREGKVAVAEVSRGTASARPQPYPVRS